MYGSDQIIDVSVFVLASIVYIFKLLENFKGVHIPDLAVWELMIWVSRYKLINKLASS